MSHPIEHRDKIIRSGMFIVNGDCDDTYVYRIYDVFENLIYVGVTKDLLGRMSAHRHNARWWIAAFRVEYDLYPTRALALKVEAQSISRLNPSHNLTYLTGR